MSAFGLKEMVGFEGLRRAPVIRLTPARDQNRALTLSQKLRPLSLLL